MLLQVKGLTKSYYSEVEEFKILKGIDFEIEEGDFLSIMGPSGSGKSTLMHILGALDKPTKGRYYLKNHSVDNMNDSELSLIRNQEIGFVFQAFHLIPQNTVLENVLLPSHYGKNSEVSEQTAIKLLEAIGLGERVYFRPSQLSGGQCQRVAIARSLLNNPSIIMADEPTGNLDSKTGNDIMAILQYLNRLGKTIIMVTHEPDIAQHTKRIMYLKDGLIDRFEKVEKPIQAKTDLSFSLDDIFESSN
ncbi:MAG: macrolide ABC transporter ATP-binding protein [Candidatus Cloacimonadota bacterium]|nr:MAG: macrolide ABC transporter ATP-binding protein [Candidatus Cloacimonadota bacterium]